MIIKTTILFCACFVLFARAGTERRKPGERRTSTWHLIRKQRVQNSKAAESPAEGHKSAKPQGKERIVHFPKERSLGRLMFQDADAVRNIQTFYYWTGAGDSDWEYLAEARGDVKVPADNRLSLSIDRNAWKDLSSLINFGSEDLYMLSFGGVENDSRWLPDDRCMPHVAHLTGLKILMLGNTNISASGLKLLENLNLLERLSAPRRLTNAGLAEVARLSSLKALYINDHSLTNIGLAHLARLELLEELDLVGKGRLNDAGLVHLAKMPRLQYLLLQGKKFTDAGTIHLKNIPSLKILNLGRLPVTNIGLVHLSKCSGLENLSLYRTKVTDDGLAHLKSMPSLKKLHLLFTHVTDEGLVHLGQIRSLEYLQLPSYPYYI